VAGGTLVRLIERSLHSSSPGRTVIEGISGREAAVIGTASKIGCSPGAALALLLILLLVGVSPASGAGVRLVRDIVPGDTGSKPRVLVNVSGTLFFVAETRAHGAELWRSDGTRRGTRLVRDIVPGPVGSEVLRGREVAGTLFFLANDGIHGRELWRSDGTAAGTRLVRDIKPGSGSSHYRWAWGQDAATLGGTLLFTANDGVHGWELWRSDGTEAGTTLVRDIFPGREPVDFGPAGLSTIGDAVLFATDDGVHGHELWRSDGTEAGTTLVRDIRPGPVSSGGGWPVTEMDGTQFLAANDGLFGHELWRSDGTEAGTTLVRDIAPGRRGSLEPALKEVAGTLFLSADDGEHGFELWRSDGTASGTRLVRDIVQGRRGASPGRFTAADELLFFTHFTGDRLFRSDGTRAGTKSVGYFDYYLGKLASVGGILFFPGEKPLYNRELWRSDGTRAGTRRVRDIKPWATRSFSPPARALTGASFGRRCRR